MSGRMLVALALAWVACLAPAKGAESGSSGDPVRARVFEVRHRALADAAELVSSVLSPDGEVKLQPRLKTLVVTDHVSVLDRVDSLLRGYDLPPRNVEVTLTLLLGSDTREEEPPGGVGPREIQREVRGVSETLGDFTRWTNYELLGSRSVIAVEGQVVTVGLSDEYRVTLVVGPVQPPSARSPQEVIRFSRLMLERLSSTEAGQGQATELYSTSVLLPAGKLLMVGAARGPESRKALFLTIRARAV